MKLHFFTIPLPFDGQAQVLNRFLNAHRVLRLEKHLLSDDNYCLRELLYIHYMSSYSSNRVNARVELNLLGTDADFGRKMEEIIKYLFSRSDIISEYRRVLDEYFEFSIYLPDSSIRGPLQERLIQFKRALESVEAIKQYQFVKANLYRSINVNETIRAGTFESKIDELVSVILKSLGR